MGSKRTVILIAAILIGAIAGYALYTYVNGVEERAYDNAKRVKVYVVAQDISAGTASDVILANRQIIEKDLPAEFLPPTALTDTALVSGKVASVNLVQGQLVVTGMFGDQVAVPDNWSDRLKPDHVAVSISVDQVKAVGGLLMPGDKVTMLVTGLAPEGAAPAPEGGAAVGPVSFLYQNVEILAIGNVGVGADAATAVPAGGTMTFAVPPAAAQRIIATNDKIYLALEPKGYVPVELPPVDGENLFDKPLTPYADSAAK